MIDHLFRFVFAGAIFFGKLSVQIGSKLWLMKKKFLLAALSALFSLSTYAFGAASGKKTTTILKPNAELIRLQKTMDRLPELHQSFISSNQKQLLELSNNLDALKKERQTKRETMLQLRKDFIKATHSLETNYDAILAEKKEAAEFKHLLANKTTELEQLQNKISGLEFQHKKTEIEFKKKLWKRNTTISHLEKSMTDLETQIKNLQQQGQTKTSVIQALELKVNEQACTLAENKVLLQQFVKQTEQNQITIETLKKDLEFKTEESSNYMVQFNLLNQKMTELHEKWDAREERSNVESIFRAAERISHFVKLKR